MKIYTASFDMATPSPQKIWVPPYSKFQIGIKVTRGGEALPDGWSFYVYKNTKGQWQVYEAGEAGGFTTYDMTSTTQKTDKYYIVVYDDDDMEQGTFELDQTTTGSGVFDVSVEGESYEAGDGVVIEYGTIKIDDDEVPTFEEQTLKLKTATFNMQSLNNSVTSLTSDMLTSNYVKDSTLTSNYYTKSELTGVCPTRDEIAGTYAEKATTPSYTTGGSGQTLTLGEYTYQTTELSGEYDDGTTFSFTILADNS